MLDKLRRAAMWPIGSFGLEPGRALTNARPSPQERQAQRDEQWAYVRARFPEHAPATSHQRRRPTQRRT